MATLFIVLVHGWSVDDLTTYGELPERLRTEYGQRGVDVVVQSIWLGQYVSFHDEIKILDISRAFEEAVKTQLTPNIPAGSRFICITHSTGAPVVRDWWERFHRKTGDACPMSHLIMLAPANFGSALAQLGKSTLSQLKFWLHHEQPGQGVLDWLELGSEDSWALNAEWIQLKALPDPPIDFYPFVLTGQAIDRNFYDHLNRYTGELGSDGVVRSAAANLNASLITIEQTFTQNPDGVISQLSPTITYYTAPETAFRIVPKRSHSGDTMGIMASVKTNPDPVDPNKDTVDAIMECIGVATAAQYAALSTTFVQATATLQQQELVETLPAGLFALNTRYFIHDRFCMVIFRVRDTHGFPVTDYKLVFTVGPNNNPNHLPEGFFSDRQQNQLDNETVTYFVNYDILNGSPAITSPAGTILRNANKGITQLGLTVIPKPDEGFVRYLPLELSANNVFFQQIVKPNSTILIDITLQRVVSNQVYRNIGPVTTNPATSFRDILPGANVLPADK